MLFFGSRIVNKLFQILLFCFLVYLAISSIKKIKKARQFEENLQGDIINRYIKENAAFDFNEDEFNLKDKTGLEDNIPDLPKHDFKIELNENVKEENNNEQPETNNEQHEIKNEQPLDVDSNPINNQQNEKNVNLNNEEQENAKQEVVNKEQSELPVDEEQKNQEQAGVTMPMYIDIADRHSWAMTNKTYELILQQKCKEMVYDDVSTLPSVSVIITFHESEKLTHLLHTLHSIVQFSPPEVLKEIIMISDNSSKPDHFAPLENYVNSVFPGIVKIHRSDRPLGLIWARQWGVELSTGEVVCSMDAHMEVQPGWIVPILHEIKRDRKIMITPYLDWMKPQPDGTWVYEHGNSRYKTVWFWWNMFFTFMELPKQFIATQNPTDPVSGPCSVGTIWAMNREFFHEIGGLDTGMKFWGGENIDLPIRVFLFGGKHIQLPCSHAAHLEEKGQRSYRSGQMKDTAANYVRVVETWFTPEYKDVIYYYNPKWKDKDYGDISSRLQLKDKAIYNFTYYMRNFYPELKAPGIDCFAWGTLTNIGLEALGQRSYCFSVYPNPHYISLDNCRQVVPHNKGMLWTTDGELRLAGHIVTHSTSSNLNIGNYVAMYGTDKITRFFHYPNGLLKFYNKFTDNSDCVVAAVIREKPYITKKKCDPSDPFQQWTFTTYTKEYSDFVTRTEPYPVRNNDLVPYYDKLWQLTDANYSNRTT